MLAAVRRRRHDQASAYVALEQIAQLRLQSAVEGGDAAPADADQHRNRSRRRTDDVHHDVQRPWVVDSLKEHLHDWPSDENGLQAKEEHLQSNRELCGIQFPTESYDFRKESLDLT